jgi:hypothetical protein
LHRTYSRLWPLAATSNAEIRAGVEYSFEVGSFEIAPQFTVDFVDGDAVIVFGAVFAKGF